MSAKWFPISRVMGGRGRNRPGVEATVDSFSTVGENTFKPAAANMLSRTLWVQIVKPRQLLEDRFHPAAGRQIAKASRTKDEDCLRRTKNANEAKDQREKGGNFNGCLLTQQILQVCRSNLQSLNGTEMLVCASLLVLHIGGVCAFHPLLAPTEQSCCLNF